MAWGYKAEVLPKVCDIFLQAREKRLLPHNQQHIADRAEILVRGLAQTGIIALVDEATGFQAIRDKEALQAILDKYLRQELAAWAKRFPDEFYEQMFRLRRWQWKGMKVNKPQVVGHYTRDLVYERLAPGILQELEERTPKNSRGQRKVRFHQWLTADVDHPALAQHLYALIGFMRVADSWSAAKSSIGWWNERTPRRVTRYSCRWRRVKSDPLAARPREAATKSWNCWSRSATQC